MKLLITHIQIVSDRIKPESYLILLIHLTSFRTTIQCLYKIKLKQEVLFQNNYMHHTSDQEVLARALILLHANATAAAAGLW